MIVVVNMVVTVVVVVAVVVACCRFWFVWVMQPLPSLVSTYFLILYTILAHMAQWLSTYFIVNAIATVKGCVFKSQRKQMFLHLFNLN